MRLLGCRAECEALDGLLADALAGRSRVAVLRGEAGAGKSALLNYVSERVADWHVATAVGVESEMELPYSGLHQLCSPMLGQLDGLPVPQREALATVFGQAPVRRPTGSWLDSPRLRCSRRSPSGNRWSASSMTRSGSTRPPGRSSDSSHGGSSLSGSLSSARRERAATSPSGLSGSELSQPVAPSKPGSWPSRPSRLPSR